MILRGRSVGLETRPILVAACALVFGLSCHADVVGVAAPRGARIQAPTTVSARPAAVPVAVAPPAAADDPGRRLFLERCSSCHDADGHKPLDEGAPLSERRMALEAIQKTVDGRLAAASLEDRRAVARYIASLQERTAR
jgi:mono/diheme cytochrome c family protein